MSNNKCFKVWASASIVYWCSVFFFCHFDETDGSRMQNLIKLNSFLLWRVCGEDNQDSLSGQLSLLTNSFPILQLYTFNISTILGPTLPPHSSFHLVQRWQIKRQKTICWGKKRCKNYEICEVVGGWSMRMFKKQQQMALENFSFSSDIFSFCFFLSHFCCYLTIVLNMLSSTHLAQSVSFNQSW